MPRILVAGGFGRLGSRAVDKLLTKGYQVTVVDNMSGDRLKVLESITSRVEFVKSDISELKHLEGKFDYVWYIAGAAMRKDWESHPVEIIMPNSIGNINLIRLALDNKARYLYTSSSEVYGNPTLIPTPETHFTAMNHLGSRAPYDESKKFGEVIVKAYSDEYGLKGVVVRLFNPYGPRMGRIVDNFVEMALANKEIPVDGDGSQTRSFCYVDDLVEGMITVLEKGKEGEAYNVGNSSEETRIIDLANMIIGMTGSKSGVSFKERPPSDPARRCPDISKITKLGYRPKVALRDGVNKIISSLKN